MCLVARCVHLEVIENAVTEERRQTLCTLTAVSISRVYLRNLRISLQAENGSFAAENEIDWRFNTPGAPHVGGVWERLERPVKEVMMGIMQDKVLTDWQLATLLSEVESILNSRPLTHSSEDIDDFEALTPNHALVGNRANWQTT